VSDTAFPSLPVRYARLVKIEHTVFALPFAYVGAFLAVGGVPETHDLFWITAAMVGARSLAMALNRLIDAGIDARNPRTAGREIPAGALGVGAVIAFCLIALFVFLVSVWQLDPIVRWLWPIPVAAFVVYPYLKRFTWLCHLWLGAVDGLAPVGAWVAIKGDLPWTAWTHGSPGSTCSTRCSTWRSTASRASIRGPSASARAGRSRAPGPCTSSRSPRSSPRESASASTGATGPASRA
jgi:4-hydroxybenzoate polyprenyltransferase